MVLRDINYIRDYKPVVFVPAGVSDKKRHYINGIPKTFYPINGVPGIVKLMEQIANVPDLGDIVVWTDKERLSGLTESIERRLEKKDKKLILIEQKKSLIESSTYAIMEYIKELQARAGIKQKEERYNKNNKNKVSIEDIISKTPEIKQLEAYVITGDSFLLSDYEIKAAYDFLSKRKEDNLWLFTEKGSFDSFFSRLPSLDRKKSKMLFYRHFHNNKEVYARFGGIIKIKAFSISPVVLELIEKIYSHRDSSSLIAGLLGAYLDYKQEKEKFTERIKKERKISDNDIKKMKSDFVKFVASNSKYTNIPVIRQILVAAGLYKDTYKSFEFISSLMTKISGINSGIALSNIIGNVFDADTEYAAGYIAENFEKIKIAKYDFYIENGFRFWV